MVSTEERKDWASGRKRGRNKLEEPGSRKDAAGLYDYDARAKGWLISH